MLNRGKYSGLRKSFTENDVNPMDYMANLSDVMLVLAVGIMLALVMAWQLNISEISEMMQQEQGMQEVGMVYVDEKGNMYLIEDTE